MKINCHCHIFSLDCVPEEFKDRFFLNTSNPIHRMTHKLLRWLLPDDCRIEDWMDFIDLSIPEIAQRLVKEMDEAGIELSTPLMMDMGYCSAFQGVKKSYEHQVGETAAGFSLYDTQDNLVNLSDTDGQVRFLFMIGWN